METSSIAQEYYKLRDLWRTAEQNKNWKLAIWVAQYADVEIIDKFMQIEQSPVGESDDIFFRFETEYKETGYYLKNNYGMSLFHGLFLILKKIKTCTGHSGKII